MIKQEVHAIKGMQRDLTVSKFNPEFAFDAQNIRITARDNNTLLSVTNEKGNKEITLKDSNGSAVALQGTVIGYNVLNNYLTLFTTDNTTDRIYRLEGKGDCFECIALYTGSLGCSTEYPIENIGVYENENIQKVYWIDGKNQPRVINIASPKEIRDKWDDKSFDFVQEMSLEEKISIEKNYSSGGMFASGVIQYAFTYYNLYGQESNIFYTTPLYYISHSARGASPEDKVANSFLISIENADKRFGYIRIYSIHRTSIDASPTVLRLADLAIEEGTLFFTDNGTHGETVDPSELLYIGGEHIIPGTMAHKDNTLFLGNIRLGDKVVSESYRNLLKSVSPSVQFYNEYLYISPDRKGVYPYANTMNMPDPKGFKYLEWYRFGIQFQRNNGKWSEPVFVEDSQANKSLSNNMPYSERGYICKNVASVQLAGTLVTEAIKEGFTRVRGVVVFPSVSERSVIAQGILCPTVYNVQDRDSNSPFVQSSWFARPNAPFDIDEIGTSDPSGKITVYKIEKVSIFPPQEGKVYNWEGNTGNPLTDKSWTLTRILGDDERPDNDGTWAVLTPLGLSASGDPVIPFYIVGATSQHRLEVVQKTAITNTDSDADNDAWYEFNSINDAGIDSRGGSLSLSETILTINGTSTVRLPVVNRGMWAEFRHNHPIPDNTLRNAEIQLITNPPSSPSVSWNKNTEYVKNDWISQNQENFYIDQSIFTFHSPDIECSEYLRNIDTSNVKLRIVGIVPITSTLSDIDIQTSTPQLNYHNQAEMPIGFYKENVGTRNMSYLGWKGLISGAYWFDEVYGLKTENTNRLSTGFAVYPWHRNGSLNNQGTLKSDDTASRSAMLKRKVISNLRYSYYTYYMPVLWEAEEEGSDIKTGISGVQVFDSDTVSMLRIPEPAYSGIGTLTYYGNIDKVIVFPRTGEYKSDGYPIVVSGVQDTSDYTGGGTGYNVSGAHALFTGNYYQLPSSNSDTRFGTDPVSMKYKSGPHAVIALNYTKDGSQRILPTVTDYFKSKTIDVNSLNGRSYYPFWKAGSVTISQDVISSASEGFSEAMQTSPVYGFLWLGEIYRDIDKSSMFGGTDESSYEENMWIPAGEPVSLYKTGSDGKYELDSDGNKVPSGSVNVKYSYGDTFFQRYDCLKTYAFTSEDQNSIIDIVSFMCETRVNIDGRYDRNRGQVSNLNMSPSNFNLINEVYSQNNTFFSYRGINYSRYSLDYFPNTIVWSKEKSSGADVDLWTNITMASTLELDGDKGDITSLNVFNNEIYCFQRTGLSNILFNSRVQVPSSDGVPIEITNGLKVSGKRYISNTVGCSNKWSIAETPSGLYFIDNITNSIYLFNGQLNSLSDKLGFRQWIGENNSSKEWYPYGIFNNFVTSYDKNNNDIYFTNGETSLVYSELLGQFTSFMSYENTPYMFNIGSEFYAIKGGALWKQFEGEYNMFFGEYRPYSITAVSNADEPYDKIFNNIDWRADCWNAEGLSNESAFDTLEVWNEYQKGISSLEFRQNTPSPLKKKFRVWRANVPRFNTDWNGVKANNRDRIRNTWAYIKLSMNKENTDRIEFHDMIVHYSI